jgi:hypothetical protein
LPNEINVWMKPFAKRENKGQGAGLGWKKYKWQSHYK